jgi:hypothetical protein
MVSYIVDKYNKKTHAVVQIDEWNDIINDVNSKAVKSIIDGTQGLTQGTNKTTIPALVHSMSALSMMESPTFLKALKEIFWYVSSASPSEIGLLYLLRTDEFAEFINSDFNEENIKRFQLDFHITDLQGLPLSLKKAKSLKYIILNSGVPDAIIKEFRISFLIGAKNNHKRVRRDADIKRLFIFDALEYLPKIFPELIMDIDIYKNDLSKSLYPDNTKDSAMAQLNKAHREAKDRVYSNKWLEYIGQ